MRKSGVAESLGESRGEGLLQRVLYEGKTVVAKYPLLALPMARLRGHGVVLAPDTHIVIEGYPRSGNSFAVAAFGQAQPEPVRIAEHTHAPGHVIAATRAGVPALVLIRDPADACIELVIAKAYLTLRQALRGYVRFYGPLLRHRDRFVVGIFSEVITNFGAVMERVNRRYGTTFTPFQHTEENVRACFETMEGYWRGRMEPGSLLERKVGRPSEFREQLKAAMRPEYERPALAGARDRAETMYRTWLRMAADNSG